MSEFIEKKSFFKNLIDIYKVLIDDVNTFSGQISKSIKIIKLVESIDITKCEKEIRISWMQTLLDLYSIVIICRKNISKQMIRVLPNIENPDLLGPKDKRKSDLSLKDETHYMNWNFANRVRAWRRSQGDLPIQDLNDIPERMGRTDKVCDFHYKFGSEDYLIECKRINVLPDQEYKKYLKRIRKKARWAVIQLKDSANWLEIKNARKHLLLDVSIYKANEIWKINSMKNMQIYGWTDKLIEKLIEDLGTWDECFAQILICWDLVCIVDKKPISIIQRVKPVYKHDNWKDVYGGWTLIDCIWDEKIKNGTGNNRHEISLHSTMCDFAWIYEEYQQIGDNKSFWGEWKWNNSKTNNK